VFTVELDVYAGPYDLLLTLIMKEELEVFEVPLSRLVELYRSTHLAADLERDTEFADSATALVLLKSRLLSPILEAGDPEEEVPTSPEELAERLATYLKVRRGAERLAGRFAANAGYYPSAVALSPRQERLRIPPERLVERARRVFSRAEEPQTRHLGPITVTVQELSEVIEAALACGTRSFEEVVAGMDRLRTAVAFAATLSLSSQGRISVRQDEPLGPITLEPGEPR
jgi:segregation and condensation protein A